MQKTIKVQGMSCGHCKAHVEEALNAIPGVTAVVDLDAAIASVNIDGNVTDEQLRNAVVDAGYEVTGIE